MFSRMPRLLFLWIFSLSTSTWLLHAVASEESVPTYSAWDDASWAVWDVKVSSLLGDDKQAMYDNHIARCREAAGPKDRADAHCYVDEYHRMQMNMFQPRSMYNYTQKGFHKLRVPNDLFAAIKAFWDINKDKEGEVEWEDKISPYHNHWDTPPTFIKIQDQKFPGGGPDLAAFVSDRVRDVLEEWTGQFLSGSSVYGIRIYHNDSILTPHVDRIPLIASAIINVDQDVDEPWPLEVYDHNGLAHNVTMEPGDMVLYESHSVIHGRPFPMRGRFFANIFVHFEVLGDIANTDLPKSGGLPPYVMPGSSWEPEYWKDFPKGWNTLDNLEDIIVRGDLRTFEYIRRRRPEIASKALDGRTGWSPIHEAIRGMHLKFVQYLVMECGIDVNLPAYVPYPVHPLDIAYSSIRDKHHPMFHFLLSHGAQRSNVSKKAAPVVQQER